MKIYDKHNTKLYCGNNIEFMQELDSNCIDLTLTSPPYDDLRTYNCYSFDFENTAKQLYRITRCGGAVVWIVNDSSTDNNESGTSFRHALYFKEIGFKLYDTMIWHKPNPMPLNHRRYEQSFEYMFVLVKDYLKTFNPIKIDSSTGGKLQSGTQIERDGTRKPKTGNGKATSDKKLLHNVWSNIGVGHTDGFHPAVFPERLAEQHILTFSETNDVVYDPFLGSGTTGKMAVINRRKFIGIDISQEYVEYAKNRIDKINLKTLEL
jgi:site-specific DNA-methyltransferase (adenine-specific)